MTMTKGLVLLAAAGMLAACDQTPADKSVDYHWGGTQDLKDLRAGIWIDPNGCEHWIIDDGVEGYMDLRRDRYGKPFCSDTAEKNMATGDFKGAGEIFDSL
jgi:hypothetical protein